jgi:triosephosphate isomerase
MNLDLAGAKALVEGLKAAAAQAEGVETVVAPPFTSLAAVAEAVKGTKIKCASQNVHWAEKGAFTGECAAASLKELGVEACIIGHSERRQYFGETDKSVHDRLEATLNAGLLPIVCVGESLDEREAQETWRVLETQIKGALDGFAPADLATLVIAYEPVWAIGTGKTASPAQAQEAHLFIRKKVASLYSEELASGLRILYGGSVKPDNVDELMSQPDVDGALVGGASLKADGFSRIIGFKAAAPGDPIAPGTAG